MRKRPTLIFAIVASMSLLFAWAGPIGVRAANPASGTVAQGKTVSWHFYPVIQSSPLAGSGLEVQCTPQSTATVPSYCDNFDLTVVLPSGFNTSTETATLKIDYTWTSTAPTDMDVYAIGPDGSDNGPGSPDNISTGPGEEILTLTNPVGGLWHIRSLCSTCPAGPQDAYGTATLTVTTATAPPVPPPVNPGDPSFTNYPKNNNPNDTSDLSGEVSIGSDWSTPNATTPNTVMWQDANPKTFRVTFDDTKSPPTATWTDVTFLSQGVTTLDPIGYMDHPYPGEAGFPGSGTTATIHRWFSTQLLAACSDMAYTDDDGGANGPTDWTQSQGCPVPSGPDHETVGGGPYPVSSPLYGNPVYPHAIYYCSQAIATAICGRSDNGGLSFNNGVPIYALVSPGAPVGVGQCSGLHGHVRVAPDGTVYIPNKSCTAPDGVSRPGVAVSTDAGLTWTVQTVPDGISHSPGSDPSVGIGAKNTIYLGYQSDNGNGGSHAMIAVSHNHGATWNKSYDVGAAFGIQNMEFPEVIAGDDNRAAFAFLGTTTNGSDQAANFPGVWHLYVAFTYNGGISWTTVDATPNDPVQRGEICTSGTTCGTSRNLLDFNDITTDRSGRVLVAYSDGCISTCATDAAATTGTPGFDSSLGTIARQNCSTLGVLSKGLFAAYDATGFVGCPTSPTAARVARLTAQRHGAAITFRWHMAVATGVAGFNLYAGSHRLNQRLVHVHRAPSYRYHVHYGGTRRLSLHIVLVTGRQVSVPVR